MKKTLLAVILAVVFVLSFTLCVSAADTNESTEQTDGDIILGDVNGDGVVTNADVLMIFRYIYNSELYPLPTVCNHSYGDWNVETYASCTNDGKLTRTCEKCSETEETIVKGGHLYVETVVPPTPADEGYTNHVCKICGNSYKDNIIPALGFTSGFSYTKNSDGKTCTITGLGTVTATSVAIPEEIDGYTVTAIGEKTFENETAITEIFIPNTVKTIGKRAFYGCTGLTEMTIPASVTSIGTQIFYKASNLSTVYYNSSYSNTDNPFLNLAHIKKVVFGGSSVPSYILNGCANITEVVISDSVKYIYSNAFYGCTSLTSITIPDSVTSIGSYAFYNCTSLKSVYITDIEAWLNISFSEWSSTPCCYGADLYLNGELLTTVEIPDSITKIGYAFSGCTSLASIEIPDSVTSIGSEAFSCCTSLESITIGDSVTSIGNSAFYNCTSLESVEIPDSVTSIGGYTFYNCTSLKSITIPDSVTSIGDYAFRDCTSLESITVDEGNTKYHSKNNCLIETESKTLILGCKNSIIPTDGSVTSIGNGAFYGCTSLASIEIPDSVTSIGNGAFYNCTSLTSITIPDSVTSIGDYAFRDCTSLASVEIPDSVTSIGYYAFYGCSKLTSITFEDTSTWYITTSSSYSGGTKISVTDPSTNATYFFKSVYYKYYWYKE